ncbi:MAG: hypothetical protein GY710_15725 [Desulfobacteraceae bacterium]|nr:hypothetical protein [Desulfobacteraceae bacterium]
MNQKADFDTPLEPNNYMLQSKKMDLKAGYLGKVFGSNEAAPYNISGALVILLVLSGIGTIFFKASLNADIYWNIITPVITLVMGYVFGKSSSGS